MAAPKKPSTRIVLEVKLKIPRAANVPPLTKVQAAKLAKAFKSELVASLGVRSDVTICKFQPLGRPPRPKS